jgi:REP element-mobilizing transposase RayT
MPNHVHGIIEIVGADVRAENFPPLPPPQSPLGNIIRGFKIGVTKWFQTNKNFVKGKSIWQRNYWEHIIRNENEYHCIAQYILDNPQKWELDKLNNGTGNQVMETQAIYNEKSGVINGWEA